MKIAKIVESGAWSKERVRRRGEPPAALASATRRLCDRFRQAGLAIPGAAASAARVGGGARGVVVAAAAPVVRCGRGRRRRRRRPIDALPARRLRRLTRRRFGRGQDGPVPSRDRLPMVPPRLGFLPAPHEAQHAQDPLGASPNLPLTPVALQQGPERLLRRPSTCSSIGAGWFVVTRAVCAAVPGATLRAENVVSPPQPAPKFSPPPTTVRDGAPFRADVGSSTAAERACQRRARR